MSFYYLSIETLPKVVQTIDIRNLSLITISLKSLTFLSASNIAKDLKWKKNSARMIEPF